MKTGEAQNLFSFNLPKTKRNKKQFLEFVQQIIFFACK